MAIPQRGYKHYFTSQVCFSLFNPIVLHRLLEYDHYLIGSCQMDKEVLGKKRGCVARSLLYFLPYRRHSKKNLRRKRPHIGERFGDIAGIDQNEKVNHCSQRNTIRVNDKHEVHVYNYYK